MNILDMYPDLKPKECFNKGYQDSDCVKCPLYNVSCMQENKTVFITKLFSAPPYYDDGFTE